MNRAVMTLCAPAVILLLGTWGQARAADTDEVLAPHMVVLGDEDVAAAFPLEHTSVDAWIAGVIADVQVTQVYRNDGAEPIEAVYVFPGSTRAAVHAMTMTVGERVIEAVIQERSEARETYEQARAEGRTASLLEQQRPNVFQMNVANVLPGDEVVVELSYTELMVPTDGVYEFVFPTVVGPRYSNMSVSDAPASEHWVANPYLGEGEVSPSTFELTVTLDGDLPIAQIGCDTHEVQIEYGSERQAHVWLASGHEADRDVVVRYVLADEEIRAGLLLYPGTDGEDGFFLLTVAPPERVEPDDVVGREYVFVVDVSGSMRGFPLDVSKQLIRDLLLGLRPDDRFNILLFASGSSWLSPRSLPADEQAIAEALDFVDRQRGGGGTEIVPALQQALNLPRDLDLARIVVVATDGYVQADQDTFEVVRESLGDANLFAFGIGKSVNRHLMEGMAHAGRGEPFVVLDHAEAPARAEALRDYVSSPVLRDVEVTLDGLAAYDVEPPAVPDLFADRPVTVFGRYRGRPHGEVVVSGMAADGAWESVVHVDATHERAEHEALSLLWARHRIRYLSDLGGLGRVDEVAEEITALGVQYGLMTEYTSFVAVDTEVRSDGGDPTTVIQPLQLPAGVPETAVAGSSGHVTYRSRSDVDFDDVRVDGALRRPGGVMLDRGRSSYQPLIRQRTHFNDELLDSVDEIEISVAGTGDADEPAWVAEASVLEQLDERRDEIRALYQAFRREHGKVKGTVELELQISSSGKVIDVRVLDDDTDAEALVEALVDELSGWRFGELPAAVVTTVRWSFPMR